MRVITIAALLFVTFLAIDRASSVAQAQPTPSAEQPYQPPVELGTEYEEYATGPKSGGGSSTKGSKDRSVAEVALLYLPNRVLDFIDIFRVDVGVGPAYGGAIRVTKWGQAGYRQMAPLSVRIGLRGRKLPVFVERSNELGIGPAFLQSKERTVTPGEVGVGLDLAIIGAYAGLAFDELVDFGAGIVGVDLKDDDL